MIFKYKGKEVFSVTLGNFPEYCGGALLFNFTRIEGLDTVGLSMRQAARLFEKCLLTKKWDAFPEDAELVMEHEDDDISDDDDYYNGCLKVCKFIFADKQRDPAVLSLYSLGMNMHTSRGPLAINPNSGNKTKVFELTKKYTSEEFPQ